MLRLFFIVNIVLTISAYHLTAFASAPAKEEEKRPIIITSKTLTADSKNNTATFDGSVVAKTDRITIYSDKMTVFYGNSEGKIKKIHAVGNVKVNKKGKALFSKDAIYFNDEEKIVFTGNPKAIEGENLITGKKIIFYLKDDRAVIEESRVILQNTQDLK
jgi:lipopolysaccharide export system protein LptA